MPFPMIKAVCFPVTYQAVRSIFFRGKDIIVILTNQIKFDI